MSLLSKSNRAERVTSREVSTGSNVLQDAKVINNVAEATSEQPVNIDGELVNEVTHLIRIYSDELGVGHGEPHIIQFAYGETGDLRRLDAEFVAGGVKNVFAPYNGGYKNVSLNAVVKITAITDNKYEPLF